MLSKHKIDLHPAHVWDCEECGRENFCRCVAVELDPSDPCDAELLEIARAECTETGNKVEGFWQTAPETVTCAHCGAEFEANDDRPSPYTGEGD